MEGHANEEAGNLIQDSKFKIKGLDMARIEKFE